MKTQHIRRFGKWLLLAFVAALVGCQSLGGLELNRALLNGMDTQSLQQSATVSLHLELDPDKQPSEAGQAMTELLNGAKLELQSIKTENRERMSMQGQLTLAKGNIPFQLFVDEDQMVLKADGLSRTIVVPIGENGSAAAAEDMFLDARKQLLTSYKEKGIDKSVASLIVNNLPNPKDISVISTNETIHNEQVGVYKLETNVKGSEMVPLAKTFLRNLTKDDETFKQLIGQLYDVLWPIIEPYLKDGTLEQSLPSAVPGTGDEIGPVIESVIDAASDKELAVDMLHTLVKQGLFIALIGVDSLQKSEEEPMLTLFGDDTNVNAKLYFDRNLNLRKSELELAVKSLPDNADGVKAVQLKMETENWDRNKPVKSDVLEPGANPYVVGEDGSAIDLFEAVDPESLLGQLLAEQGGGMNSQPLQLFYIPVADRGDAEHASAYIEEGTSYAPLDLIAEKMGASVTADGGAITVTAPDGTVVNLAVDSREATVDGQTVEMDGTVRLEGGVVYVPCRFVAEQLGGYVWFSEETAEIAIVLID